MNDTLTMPANAVAVPRQCGIEEVFDASFIELLKLVPRNPHVRALILKFSGKLPGQECQTFEQLKDWVEFNCARRVRSRSTSARNDDGISISVDFSEMEYGRARYSVERYGTDSFRVDADELLNIIQEKIADGAGIEQIVEAIAEKIDDDAWTQCNPELEGYGDYDYAEHDSNDSSDAEVKYSNDASNEYTPLQNHQAFQFFDPIVGQNAAIYHTAGALGNGERVWILAKLPGYIRVAGDDITEKYLLLSNSHDGKSSVTIKFTPVRVVCQNTLTLALNDGSAWRVSHHSDIHDKLKQAHEMLGLITEKFGEMEQTFQAMSRVKLDSNRLSQYLAAVYPDSTEPDKQVLVKRDRDWSEYFFDQGRGNRELGVAGSLWAGFNGVTEWIDHRKTRQNSNQRLQSAWFGESARIKSRAYTVALDKISAWN